MCSQVLGATLGGNAVNRHFLKLHDSEDVVYKLPNPYEDDERNPSPSKDDKELLAFKTLYVVGMCKLYMYMYVVSCVCEYYSALFTCTMFVCTV